MSHSKSKHSSVLSLALAALLPLGAALTVGCASNAGPGGPALDAGADPTANPRGAGSAGGSPGSSSATGGAAGSATKPTSSEGGATGTGATAPKGGAGGTGGTATTTATATGTGGSSANTPPASATGGTTGTVTPPATGGTAGTVTPPATGGTTGTVTPPPPATGGTDGTVTPPPATGGTDGTVMPPPATGGTDGTVTPPATGGTSGTVTPPPATGGTSGTTNTPPPGNPINYVFVVAMENESASSVYGSSSAPYLNGLINSYAHTTAFADPLPDAIPSEPHYVWMEAGTNAFSDTTFTGDGDPSASNSTKSTAHLATQMSAASVSWMGWMEGLDSSTGACPVSSSGFYAAKHDPYVFFQDIAGSPPSASNANCAAHHKAYTTAAMGQALSSGTVAQYNFIAPNVCNDMHGDPSCPSSNVIAAGDAWLSANLPPIINFVNAHQGVLFIVWDEPEGGTLIPFVAIGPGVKKGYTGNVAYTHSALTKSVDEIFGLPVLSTVTGANDFADLFQTGMFP